MYETLEEKMNEWIIEKGRKKQERVNETMEKNSKKFDKTKIIDYEKSKINT